MAGSYRHIGRRLKGEGGEEVQPNSPVSNQLKGNSTKLQPWRAENPVEHYRHLYENPTESGLGKNKPEKENPRAAGPSVY